jgi:DNA-binding NarL/FixJ family response regulator
MAGPVPEPCGGVQHLNDHQTEKRGCVTKSPIRVLVVDDSEPFRRFARSTVGQRPEFQIMGESSDGLEAVRSAAELQPDLILLDIGLPKLNGIEAARRIRELSPKSKILFFSENRSLEIVEEALSTGAGGYLLKSDGARELFAAMDAVLQGKPFRSSSLSSHPDGEDPRKGPATTMGAPIRARRDQIAGHHEVVFYSEDRQLIGKLVEFVGAALRTGNAAVVVATSSHQKDLLQSLQAHGVDIAAAITQGRYLTVDADDAMSHCMVNGVLDSARFLECFGTLIAKAADAVDGEHARVAAFGESVDLLLKQGNHDAVIQDEKLGNQLCQTYRVDILCGYLLDDSESITGGVMHQICAEHSAVHRP